MVAMNPQTWDKDVASIEPGGYLFYDSSKPMPPAKFRDDILSARNEGLFTPPGKRPTIQMPGNNGGANWGGAAVNPENAVAT